MKTPPKMHSAAISRRGLLHGAAIAAGGGAVLVGGLGAGPAAAAQTKLSQKAASYRGAPMGKARCDGCTQWAPPSACKIVEGVISPAGWCTLYAAKPKS